MKRFNLFLRIPKLARLLFPQIIWHMPGLPHKTIYLTFDDGPHREHTPALLEILDRYEARATFFLHGQRAAAALKIAEQIGSLGHRVANHTWQHRNLRWLPKPEIRAEILMAHAVCTALPGFAPYLRPPYGRFGPGLLSVAKTLGYRLVMWSLSPADYRPQSSADQLATALSTHVRPGDIILLHDGLPHSDTTVEAITRFIPHCLAHGFTFLSLPA